MARKSKHAANTRPMRGGIKSGSKRRHRVFHAMERTSRPGRTSLQNVSQSDPGGGGYPGSTLGQTHG